MQSVTVFCPNARRCPIKVTPGKLLREVLEEACLKQGYEADLHELSHQKKKIDLALPFRLSGLTNNVTLEMIPLEGGAVANAEIALQLENGSRKCINFAVSTTLYDILKKFSEEFNENLIDPQNNCIPSCSFMNKQYRGEVELQSVSLRSMGIRSGKSLIRYQRVKMTDEEIAAIVERVEKEKHRIQELGSEFERRRAENAERAQLEKSMMERFESEQQQARMLEEERERKQATERNNEEAMQTDAPTVLQTDAPTVQPSSAQREPTRAVENSRLQRLQNLLQSVDSSLSGHGGNVNHIVEQLAEHGRVPIGRLTQNVPTPAREEEFPLRDFKFPDAPVTSTSTAMETDQSETENIVVVEKADRKTVIFKKSDHSNASMETPPSEAEEGFYDVGVSDIKNMQKSLSEEVRRQEQKALVPKSYVDQRNRELKMTAYKHTVIRIVLGDKSVLQALFYAKEPSYHLFSFFSSLLTDSSREFDLSLVLNIPIEKSERKNLVDLGIAPASTIYAKFKTPVIDYGSLFKPDTLSEVSNDEADYMSREWIGTNTVYTPWSGVVGEEPRTVINKRNAGNYVSGERPPHQDAPKLPKWLKK